MAKSKIEWTGATWNPVTGCTKIGAGCQHCYAERVTRRFWKAWGCKAPPNHFKVKLHPKRLDLPLHWKKPRRIFVDSMSDLFHEDVPFEFITKVFDTMCAWRWPNKAAERSGDESLLVDPGHTYQVLTKRPERISEWLTWVDHNWPGDTPFNVARNFKMEDVWLGVSCSLQKDADTLIPTLLDVPLQVQRFVSFEPLLGPIDWYGDNGSAVHDFWQGFLMDGNKGVADYLHWIIVGGESGPGARPMHPDWVRGIRDHCVEAGVPFFFKGWGAWLPMEPMADEFPTCGDTTGFSGRQHDWDDYRYSIRVGKKKSGRILDGRTWEEYPK